PAGTFSVTVTTSAAPPANAIRSQLPASRSTEPSVASSTRPGPGLMVTLKLYEPAGPTLHRSTSSGVGVAPVEVSTARSSGISVGTPCSQAARGSTARTANTPGRQRIRIEDLRLAGFLYFGERYAPRARGKRHSERHRRINLRSWLHLAVLVSQTCFGGATVGLQTIAATPQHTTTDARRHRRNWFHRRARPTFARVNERRLRRRRCRRTRSWAYFTWGGGSRRA